MKAFGAFSLILLIILENSLGYAFNIYRVGSEVTGQEHNEVWKRWFDRKFSMWIGIDDQKIEHLLFQVDTGLGDATVSIKYTKAIREKFERAIKKALEWSEVAKKNQADTTKGLGCFGDDRYNICGKEGNAFEENQMGLSFFAANKGQQTNLVIDIVDRENQFRKATVHVDPPAIRQILANIQMIDQALKQAKETTSKKDLFK